MKVNICGAKTMGGVCMAAPVAGKTRCRLHGGASTGAKTAEGRKRISEANIALWAERNRLIELARKIEHATT